MFFSDKLLLHIRVAVAHLFVEDGLGQVERGMHHGVVVVGVLHQFWRGAGKFAALGKLQHSIAGKASGHALQRFYRGVQVLRVARIGNPDGLAAAEHAG